MSPARTEPGHLRRHELGRCSLRRSQGSPRFGSWNRRLHPTGSGGQVPEHYIVQVDLRKMPALIKKYANTGNYDERGAVAGKSGDEPAGGPE